MVARLERDRGFGATGCANSRKLFAWFARKTALAVRLAAAAVFGAVASTARSATAGLINQPFLLEKLLFAYCENEFRATIAAGQSLVDKAQDARTSLG